MEPKRNPFAATLDVLVVLLTLLAVALGGSTLPWQQAAIILGAGAVILASPPRRLLPWWANLFLGGALLCSLLPLLPASLAPTEFRQEVAGPLRIPLADTISLQPWLTLEGSGLFLAATVWGAFLCARHWELPRAVLMEILAGGVFLLTLGAMLVYFSHFEFPLWNVETGAFGFFPHRNQTATILGLGGVVTLALASRRLHLRHWLAALWIAAYLLLAVCLVLNYSRAGILIFFFGSVAWLVASSHWSKNYFALGMGLTGLFTLVALFTLFGGETWERFRPKETGTGAAPVLDFRVLVQQDALAMARVSSWHGLGFGNFEPTFPQHRKLSAIENRAEHPDSDWLWLALELGLPGTLLLIVAIVFLLRPVWPFERRSERRLRAAALVCVLLFLLHGLVDVSGHRLGTVWPALLLLALARMPEDHAPAPRVAPWIFRGLGAALVILGAIWLAASQSDLPLRTSGTLARLKERAAAAAKFKDQATVIAATTDALTIAPLDWSLYFQRGVAQAGPRANHAAAAQDFQRALRLEPQSSKLALEIGSAWQATDRDRAFEAWRESLRRAGREAPDRFQLMILAVASDPVSRKALWVIANGDPRLKLMLLRHVGGEEFSGFLGMWLREAPPLKDATPAQLKELFGLWFERGDRARLEAELMAHPEWIEAGGQLLAEMAAEKRDFKRAYETAVRARAAPALPARRDQRPASLLERDFHAATGAAKINFGLSLAYAQLDSRRVDEALETLGKLTLLPNCPPYIFYLHARTLAQKGDWEQAWTSWKAFSKSAK